MASPVILRGQNSSMLSLPPGTGLPPSVTHPQLPSWNVKYHLKSAASVLKFCTNTSTATGTWGTAR